MKRTISPLYLEALPRDAQAVLEQLSRLTTTGVLGGGTAIALQLGHRRSFDLDVFVSTSLRKNLLMKVKDIFGSATPIVDTPDELSCVVGHTKLSVIFYPFKALHGLVRTSYIPLFHLHDLASSKAYAIGRRGVWRDYVDIFILLQHGLTLSSIIKEATRRFTDSFNAKLFLQELSYFEDIHDLSVEWLSKKYSEDEIKQALARHVSLYMDTLNNALS